MADPWAQFAEAPADQAATPTASAQGNATDFAGFGLDPSVPKAHADPQTYVATLQQKFDAGAPIAELQQYMQANGVDPAAIDWRHLDELRKNGASARFQLDGSINPTPPPPRSLGEAFYEGVGGLAAGAGDLLGIIGNPLNATINALAGTHLSTNLGETARNATGAPAPRTQAEHVADTINRAGVGALLTSGVAGVAAKADGVAGAVAGKLADQPVTNLAAAGTGAVGGEVGADLGRKVGGTPGAVIGGIAGSVLAGGAAFGGITSARRALESRAASIAEAVPHEVAVTPEGTLTQEGHELALRHGVPEDVLAQAFGKRLAGGRRSTGGDVAAAVAEDARLPARAPDAHRPIPRAAQPSSEPPAAPAEPASLYDEAASEGVPLTRGQAEQNFDVQNDENSLRVSATREGEQARQWFGRQQEGIQSAIGRLRERFGADPGGAADRGQVLKDAVTQLRDHGAEGVRALYRQAEELGGDGLKLNTRGIHDAATDVLIDEAVPEGVKRAVSQELARYGIIGKAEPTNEAGITKVALDDGSSVSFRGPTKQLTASNAEDLRRAVNRLYDPTKPSLSGQGIKPAIDQALEDAITGASGEGQIGNAYKAARAGYRDQRQTFHAKDIIESLHANKKGTNTPVLLPERAIAQVIGTGKDGVTNLRRTKTLLLSGGTDSSRQAWQAIQHQGLADIFDSAVSRNVNHGNGQIGDVVSGAKLNSAIDKFGVDKLKELLGPEDFNGLMKLRRIIGAATIPISGTTNPSGTASKIINYMRQGTLRFAGAIPGVGHTVSAFAGLAAKGREIVATKRTLQGITGYTGPASAAESDRAAQEFLRAYIDSGTSGALVPATVTMTNAKPQQQ